MKILIDECLPRYLKSILTGHAVLTVQDAGWTSIKNGLLLTLAEESFDVFLTADQNMSYQQNLKNRNIAIILFPSNRLPEVGKYEDQLKTALKTIAAGDFIELKR